jgi:O-antigen/teichoic acid export membrane protein
MKLSKFNLATPVARQSVLILIGQALVMVSGFAFWGISAIAQTAREIGFAASLIGTSSLVSTVAVFGANQGVLKFLSNSKSKGEFLGSVVAAVLLTSITLSILIFLLVFRAGDLGSSWATLAILFVMNTALFSVNTVTDAAMAAYRFTAFNSMNYAAASIMSISALFFFVRFGAAAMLGANCVLYGLVALGSLIRVSRAGEFSWRPVLNFEILKSIFKFSSLNYLAGVFWSAPLLLLPSLVLWQLGANQAGYLSITVTLFNALLLIPAASSQALFASLSARPADSSGELRRTLLITLGFMALACLGLASAGRWLLSLFGSQYADAGYLLLLALIPLSLVAGFNLLANVNLKNTAQLIKLTNYNLLRFLVTIAVWMILLKPLGLIAVAAGFAAGHLAMALANLPPMKRALAKSQKP